MSKIFELSPKNEGEHYKMIVEMLERIAKEADLICKDPDYASLPGMGFASLEDDPHFDATVVVASVFDNLRNSYNSYREYAMGVFKEKGALLEETKIFARINIIAECFYQLVTESECEELDVMARLWFYQLYDKMADYYDIVIEDDTEGMYGYAVHCFAHLRAVAYHTARMLKKHYGYLSEEAAAG